MLTLSIAIGSALLYLLAYHTYGRWLAKKLFRLDDKNICPSVTHHDGVDFVATDKTVLFGHHFTSIAGTGPIVGPAIAIIWGWVPALLWVLFGSIFMGAVHDLGSMAISLKNHGRSVGDLAGDVVSPRVRYLFLLLIFFTVWIVIAIFGVVIAAVFSLFPEAVLPCWLQIPIAIWLGHMVYSKGKSHIIYGILATVLMYLTIIAGAHFPVHMPALLGIDPVGVWVVILLIYAYIASILPVQTLLQPRDYINAFQLCIAMLLLFGGILIAHPAMVAPAVNLKPIGAPPVFPMLFITVACGAISGFHSLVSSGTSSKQCDLESSAKPIAYGGMLLEGLLAVFVLIACGAGIGMGLKTGGELHFGIDAFTTHYADWASAGKGLGPKLHAFITGSSNMIAKLRIPPNVIKTLMGVFVASFAATTLDTATRIQRYIVGELAIACKAPHLSKKHPATAIAVLTALVLAFANGGGGTGALVLWPIFGSMNQLLAGLALLVITVWLAHKKRNLWVTLLPMLFMLFMTGWSISLSLQKFWIDKNPLLLSIGVITVLLETWMIMEAVSAIRKARRTTTD